jgi:hypothetical protein
MKPEPSDRENLKVLYEDLQRTGSVEGTAKPWVADAFELLVAGPGT